MPVETDVEAVALIQPITEKRLVAVTVLFLNPRYADEYRRSGIIVGATYKLHIATREQQLNTFGQEAQKLKGESLTQVRVLGLEGTESEA